MDDKYHKAIFQLDNLLRILLVESDDIKNKRVDRWIKLWEKIEIENQDIYNEIYKNK
jgi:hypothetical protein